MNFNEDVIRGIATEYARSNGELFLVDSFVVICRFLHENPNRLSLSATKAEKVVGFTPSVSEPNTLHKLAQKHFNGYRNSNVPTAPSTIPDEAVSIVLEETYGYTPQESARIKVEHQHSMLAENCVGGLLERYIDSKMCDHNWVWCCGDFVRAIDFIHYNNRTNSWSALQIKNRDNTENSSSSAIRNGTRIEKWYRSFSKSTARSRALNFVNWDNLPLSMHGYGLSEAGFHEYISAYIGANR